MTVPNQPAPGDPCWVELYTSDPERSIAFYRELFGWTVDRAPAEFGGYLTFRKNGLAVAGGMGRMAGDDSPEQWTVYLASPDAAATEKKAVAQGATVVVPTMAIGDIGHMAVLGDIGGAGVGIWQAGTFGGIETAALVTGGQWSDHHGVPAWFELHTRDYDAALDFYRTAFDWRDPFAVADGPGYRYTTIHAQSPMLGGVLDAAAFLPEGAPASWTVYFGATDVDESVAKVVELGGSVLSPAQDAEFGRMATVTDATGARFNLGGNKAG
ncbi:VOC family protein [Nocardia brasiliensis]|uniref:VOC domain-containing protein n=1 Tax=Nocardia brasiliensis (strain ATCC 700358 / HUJEG-1) TaxID=1133849 RepID=K0EX09_NOCB7|nr:VOC family protein [Nocardia brasiliensis]AFU04383.1 hypothetical protein O3I_032170 [Nocardia brasiliensis ATCC 700358]OCF91522.1 glyoxalase [Nocardia brasiliensis]